MGKLEDTDIMYLRGEYIEYFTKLEISIEHCILMFFRNYTSTTDDFEKYQQKIFNERLDIFFSTKFFRKEGISVSDKLAWVEFILKLTNIEFHNTYPKFFKMIKKLIEYRNLIAHGLVQTVDSKKGFVKLKNTFIKPSEPNEMQWQLIPTFYEIKNLHTST